MNIDHRVTAMVISELSSPAHNQWYKNDISLFSVSSCNIICPSVDKLAKFEVYESLKCGYPTNILVFEIPVFMFRNTSSETIGLGRFEVWSAEVFL